jgi:hypothetical protein
VTTFAPKPGAVVRSGRAGKLEVGEEELRYRLVLGGRLFLAYNKGSTQYGDFYRSKPDFFPVLTPSGRQVTQTRSYRFNHHHSIWIGHAKINGVNVFHDNNPTRTNLGDITIERAEDRFVDVPTSLADGASGRAAVETKAWRLETTNGWVAKDGRRLCTEQREITVTPATFGGRAHVLDVDSRLEATDGEIVLEKDTHAYIGVRVADTMDEEDGGRLRNATGQEGESGCMGQVAAWCDYGGEVAGERVGVALLVHPENPQTAFFARGYGTMLANPTLHGPLRVPAGESLTQHFRLLIHDGEWSQEELNAAHAAYAADPVA